MIELLSNFAAKCGSGGFFGLPSWHQYLNKDEAASKVTGKCEVSFNLMQNGEFNGTDILLIALSIVDILIRIAALVAVFFVMYGGIKYSISQGSPDGTKAAMSIIMNALIGLGIAIIAGAFVAFIGNYIK